MFRSLCKWMLTALPVAGLLMSPFVAEAAPKKRVQARPNRTVYTPYGTFRNSPDGPVLRNTARGYFYVPASNPVPPYGYYGSQQYYSQWVPSNFYNFR
jgi:hypothetical protein